MTTHAATLLLADNDPGFFASLTDQRSNCQVVVCDNHSKARKAMLDTLGDERAAPGIYLLLGDNACYIGQSKNLKARIGTHTRNKKVEFTRAIVLMRTDLLAILDYLEAALFVRLKKLGINLEQQDLDQTYQRERARYTPIQLTLYDELSALFFSYARMFGLVVEPPTKRKTADDETPSTDETPATPPPALSTPPDTGTTPKAEPAPAPVSGLSLFAQWNNT